MTVNVLNVTIDANTAMSMVATNAPINISLILKDYAQYVVLIVIPALMKLLVLNVMIPSLLIRKVLVLKTMLIALSQETMDANNVKIASLLIWKLDSALNAVVAAQNVLLLVLVKIVNLPLNLLMPMENAQPSLGLLLCPLFWPLPSWEVFSKLIPVTTPRELLL